MVKELLLGTLIIVYATVRLVVQLIPDRKRRKVVSNLIHVFALIFGFMYMVNVILS